MQNRHRSIRQLSVVAVMALATITWAQLTAKKVHAQALSTPLTIGQLEGPWSTTLIGNTGCGWTALNVTFRLGPAGKGLATYQSHTSGCGDGTTTGVTFEVQTLNANGSGTANLSCGPSCGWEFNIQVAPNREVFNLVDVDPANPGNYLAGVAVRQLPAGS
jgi:hypothetical protein